MFIATNPCQLDSNDMLRKSKSEIYWEKMITDFRCVTGSEKEFWGITFLSY